MRRDLRREKTGGCDGVSRLQAAENGPPPGSSEAAWSRRRVRQVIFKLVSKEPGAVHHF